MRQIDVAIIGAGAAGLAAAIQLHQNGVEKIVLFEKNDALGGILFQCIHSGFGLKTYQEELTGPEYAQRQIDLLLSLNIEIKLETLVLTLDQDKRLTYSNKQEGYQEIEARAVLFATGCIERTRYHIAIPGERPSGVLTAGLAQRYVNIEGLSIGKDIFILGSGDIGLIMARRLKLEGANVLGVAEILPYSNGLTRNVVQCLQDFEIPLYLSHTVTKIFGKARLTHIELAQVDEEYRVIEHTRQKIACDTLLLSIGLVPSITLLSKKDVLLCKSTNSVVVDESYMSSLAGVFACGNALHVHDLVDWVTEEAQDAANHITDFLHNATKPHKNFIDISFVGNVRYCVPQRVSCNPAEPITLKFRVKSPQEQARIVVIANEEIIYSKLHHFLLPSEMIQIRLNALPKGLKSISLEVRSK